MTHQMAARSGEFLSLRTVIQLYLSVLILTACKRITYGKILAEIFLWAYCYYYYYYYYY